MRVLPDAALFATRAHGQTDDAARDMPYTWVHPDDDYRR
jgi:hypothetical protein